MNSTTGLRVGDSVRNPPVMGLGSGMEGTRNENNAKALVVLLWPGGLLFLDSVTKLFLKLLLTGLPFILVPPEAGFSKSSSYRSYRRRVLLN
jgi:hypothetical protein